jgi:DNA-binding GntR family transcriptional regulator
MAQAGDIMRTGLVIVDDLGRPGALPGPDLPGLDRLDAPSTLRQAVVERLRTAIVSAELQPGALLRETALAGRLGVSATPVREALGELAFEGLVEIEAHRLKRVAPIDFEATQNLFQVQTQLWRLGYVWGMPKVGAAELDQLDGAIALYRQALAQEDRLAAIRAGLDFHTVFITASANRELLRSTLDRRSLIARFILLHGRSTISSSGLKHHEAMLRCFRRGETAEVLDHLDRLAERLIAMASPATA